MNFRLGGINELSTIDADGIAFVIFFQGCSRHCPGCHNPTLQPHSEGRETDIWELLDRIREHVEWYDSVAFQGGEPLEQPAALLAMLRAIKLTDLQHLKTWLYTGFELEQVPEEIKALCDVIVAGGFRQDLFVPGRFPASTNQVVWRAAP